MTGQKRPGTGLVVILVVVGIVLVLGLGVGGYLGFQALTASDDNPTGQAAVEGSGEIFSPPSKPYSVEIPEGMVKTGTLSGKARNGAFDEVGEEAARGYSSEYAGHPDVWGKGARVDQKNTKLDGQDAIEINARFSPGGDPEPSTFFRIYFIDPPSGPTILITCDWNSTDTADIESACETLVSSFKVKN